MLLETVGKSLDIFVSKIIPLFSKNINKNDDLLKYLYHEITLDPLHNGIMINKTKDLALVQNAASAGIKVKLGLFR